MIGLLFVLVELIYTLAYFFLRITGLWISFIVFIVLLLINELIVTVPDPVIYYSLMFSLVPSAILFLRNIYNIALNIIYFVKESIR